MLRGHAVNSVSLRKLSHVDFCEANNETQKQETGYRVNIKNFLKVRLNCAAHRLECERVKIRFEHYYVRMQGGRGGSFYLSRNISRHSPKTIAV
jgi:hypothetical protein